MINLQVRLAETVQNVGILKVTSQPIITISDLFLYISSLIIYSRVIIPLSLLPLRAKRSDNQRYEVCYIS